MLINRHIVAAFLALAAGQQNVHAFTPASLSVGGGARAGSTARFSTAVSESSTAVDVSVDYDAAARLAYDDWCAKYSKESSDAKFATFKANYEAITVANVVAAKDARDNGKDRPKNLDLNEFGDMTEAEYMAMQSGESAPPAAVEEEAAPGSTAVSESSTAVDVSVDYDAAARLAYDDWCAKYSKESSEAKFATFKANYEAITAANVEAAKDARDNGTDRPKDLDLNEFGDMTEAEYMAMQSGESAPPAAVEEEAAPGKGALESAMEASMAQSEASSALADAADALAEEEEKLAKQLGMESIEELEQAIDAMEGIDTDGGEIDTSDVREARVRSAYIDWCKEYGKTQDEARFPTFSSNFLAMEEYAKENGREMVLNKYADCSEEEYRQLTEAPKPVIEEPKKVEAVVEKKVEAPVVEKKEEPKVVEEPKAVEKPAPKVEEKKAEPVAKVEEKKVEVKKPEVKKEAPKPPAAKPKPKPKPVPVLSLEEQAIADARASAEKEAAQVAARRARDEAAAAIELQKAKEAMEKQQQLAAKRAAAVVPKPPVVASTPPVKEVKEPVKEVKKAPVAKQPASPFASIFGGAAATAKKPVEKKVVAPPKPVAKKAPVKPAVPAKPAATPAKTEAKGDIFSSLFGGAPAKPAEKKPAAPVVKAAEKKVTPPPKPAAPVAKAPEKKETKPSNDIFGSFFGGASAKPVQKKAAAPAKPVAKKAPVKPAAPAVTEKKEASKEINMAPNAMTDALGSFFGTSSAKPVQKKAPAPAAVEKKAPAKPAAPARKPSPTLSLFNAPKQKPQPKAPPAPVVEKKKPATSTFSLFGSAPKPAPKTPPPAPVPVARKPSPAFTFGAPKPKPAPVKAKAPPAPVPVRKPAGTFSLFGSAPKPAPKSPPPAPAPVARKPSPTFSLFNAPKPKPAAKSPPPAPVPVARKPSPTFSLFNAPKPAAKTPPPAPVVEKKKPVAKGSFGGFFGGSSPSKPKATPKQTPPPQKKSVASRAPPAKKAPVVATKKAQKGSAFGGFSFGGAKTAAPKKAAKVAQDNIPILSKFKQNADGSITGIVRNSKSFRQGTQITTSPVPRGAKAGSVVKTSSGSKYRLE